jgi:hypothetical protein
MGSLGSSKSPGVPGRLALEDRQIRRWEMRRPIVESTRLFSKGMEVCFKTAVWSRGLSVCCVHGGVDSHAPQDFA